MEMEMEEIVPTLVPDENGVYPEHDGPYCNAHDWITGGTDKDGRLSFAGGDICAGCRRTLSDEEWSSLNRDVWDSDASVRCERQRLYQVAWLCPDCAGGADGYALSDRYTEVVQSDDDVIDCCGCRDCTKMREEDETAE